ncbi:MAG: hypothetical protein ACK5JR_07655 [Tropicimonas sp.]|uniref:hypothetical protein n=1 Tax=Tropicimonas sp. TaxID=2067044 RepID=UPI003A88AD6E
MRKEILRHIRGHIQGTGLIALLALALVATAFAHRLPNATGLGIEAYVLAGGDISAICGGGGNDGEAGSRMCPACHVIGSAMLPDTPESLVEANHTFVATVVAPRESRAIRAVRDPARGMRAPPLA